jgi:replicative DNA helicase
MGKSTLADTIATNVAKAGHGVLFLSLEMPRKALDARRISAATYRTQMPIPYSRALNHQMAPAEHEHFVRVGMALKRLPIATEERPNPSMVEIATRVRKTRQVRRRWQAAGLVIADHVGNQTARPCAPWSISRQISTISRHSRSPRMSRCWPCTSSTVAWRAARQAPFMSDPRPAAIGADADGVWLLFRPAYLRKPEDSEAAKDPVKELQRLRDYEAKKHVLEIIADKTRNAETGTVTAFCDVAFNVVDNLDRRHP